MFYFTSYKEEVMMKLLVIKMSLVSGCFIINPEQLLKKVISIIIIVQYY